MSSASGVFLVDYSDKAIAIFGDTQSYKNMIAEKGGKFNMSLTYEGTKRPGWIFPKKLKPTIEEFVNDINTGKINIVSVSSSVANEVSKNPNDSIMLIVDSLKRTILELSTRLERVEQELALSKTTIRSKLPVDKPQLKSEVAEEYNSDEEVDVKPKRLLIKKKN